MLDNVVLVLVNLSRSHVYQGRISDVLDAAHEVNTIIQGFGVERMSMIAAAYIPDLQLYTDQEGGSNAMAMEYQAVCTDQQHEFTELPIVPVLLKTGDCENVPAIMDAHFKEGHAQGRVRTCIEL